MKKSILNLGKALNKVELKDISGGDPLCSASICAMWNTLVLKPACICYY
ncbi:hypothetical protein TCRASSO_60327 [Tenacibaculum crassostreae]